LFDTCKAGYPAAACGTFWLLPSKPQLPGCVAAGEAGSRPCADMLYRLCCHHPTPTGTQRELAVARAEVQRLTASVAEWQVGASASVCEAWLACFPRVACAPVSACARLSGEGCAVAGWRCADVGSCCECMQSGRRKPACLSRKLVGPGMLSLFARAWPSSSLPCRV
jgi:hypothetical protein